ncbi:MAG TPA: 3-hydroxyacyl-CoA dehydrogenase [Spirochaetota bacterium]|nr:3-hydroxyacyl-CoA dehydrogenase [Spirochaetota bacterium]HQO40228.1 3-hydroxyacyl-CoA dehydrogenase [Spirochaetota bacterium]
MNIDDIKKVVLLGAGTMGQQISVPCSLSGYDVVIYDINADALAKAMERIPEIFKGFVLWKKCTQDEADAAIKRISTTTDAELAAKGADIINESVPEKPDLKVKIFSQFNKLCPERTIFTTNTSTLLPSMIADATGRPEKFLALHYHDVSMTNVVDIMPHPGTSKEAVQLVREFAIRTGMLPIMLEKEHSGYVFNYMIGAVFTAALTLKTRNVASIEDIDRSWMGVTRMMFGPFGLMDSIGLDTMLSFTEYWAEKNNDDHWRKHAALLRSYVDQGYLGKKTKKGFYDYPKPAFMQPEFLKGVK